MNKTSLQAYAEFLEDSLRLGIKVTSHNTCEILEVVNGLLICQSQIEQLKAQSKLSVWYGSMPESNGKSNWTAILYRKSEEWLGGLAEGITIDRSEYPDRVRYEADRMRYLIGEIEKEPFILDYDSDKRSDYVYPEDPEVVELKAALTLIMRAAEGAKVNCGSDPESPDAIRNAALASIAAVAAQGLGLSKGPKLSEGVQVQIYIFKSGWRKVTVKAENYERACYRARMTLDYRMEREDVEAPVSHSLTLIETRELGATK